MTPSASGSASASASQRPIPVGQPFDFGERTVGLDRATGTAVFMEWASGPPPRIDGYTVSAPLVTTDPPHRGELHPDADELLYIASGSVKVVLELDGGDQTVDVGPGQAIVVPRGVWHQVLTQEPTRLVHITPGPGADHRPLPRE